MARRATGKGRERTYKVAAILKGGANRRWAESIGGGAGGKGRGGGGGRGGGKEEEEEEEEEEEQAELIGGRSR